MILIVGYTGSLVSNSCTKIVVILWPNFYLCFNLFKPVTVVIKSNLFHQRGKGESESNNKLDQQI